MSWSLKVFGVIKNWWVGGVFILRGLCALLIHMTLVTFRFNPLWKVLSVSWCILRNRWMFCIGNFWFFHRNVLRGISCLLSTWIAMNGHMVKLFMKPFHETVSPVYCVRGDHLYGGVQEFYSSRKSPGINQMSGNCRGIFSWHFCSITLLYYWHSWFGYVCWLIHGSSCSLAQTMDGRIMRCNIISSCQSAATSEIVKLFRSRVWLM